jgi:hypothetical protein
MHSYERRLWEFVWSVGWMMLLVGTNNGREGVVGIGN